MGLITPTLPTSGQDRGTEEVDATNTLQAILTLVNGSLDGSNLAAAAFASYDTLLLQTVGSLTSADTTGLRIFDQSGAPFASGANLGGRGPGLIIPSSNPWLLPGKTPKLRLVVSVICNNVAPGAGQVTVNLRPVTPGGTGGNMTLTVGAQVVATSAITPVQAGIVTTTTVDISTPPAGLYVFAAAMSSALAANALLFLAMRVELHHV